MKLPSTSTAGKSVSSKFIGFILSKREVVDERDEEARSTAVACSDYRM